MPPARYWIETVPLERFCDRARHAIASSTARVTGGGVVSLPTSTLSTLTPRHGTSSPAPAPAAPTTTTQPTTTIDGADPLSVAAVAAFLASRTRLAHHLRRDELDGHALLAREAVPSPTTPATIDRSGGGDDGVALAWGPAEVALPPTANLLDALSAAAAACAATPFRLLLAPPTPAVHHHTHKHTRPPAALGDALLRQLTPHHTHNHAQLGAGLVRPVNASVDGRSLLRLAAEREHAGARMAGFVDVLHPATHGWLERWLVLTPSAATLFAVTDAKGAEATRKETAFMLRPLEVLDLDAPDAAVALVGAREWQVYTAGCLYTLRCAGASEALAWVTAATHRATTLCDASLLAAPDAALAADAAARSERDAALAAALPDVRSTLHVSALRDHLQRHARTLGVDAALQAWMHIRAYELAHPLTPLTAPWLAAGVAANNGGAILPPNPLPVPACVAYAAVEAYLDRGDALAATYHAATLYYRFLAPGAPAVVDAPLELVSALRSQLAAALASQATAGVMPPSAPTTLPAPLLPPLGRPTDFLLPPPDAFYPLRLHLEATLAVTLVVPYAAAAARLITPPAPGPPGTATSPDAAAAAQSRRPSFARRARSLAPGGKREASGVTAPIESRDRAASSSLARRPSAAGAGGRRDSNAAQQQRRDSERRASRVAFMMADDDAAAAAVEEAEAWQPPPPLPPSSALTFAAAAWAQEAEARLKYQQQQQQAAELSARRTGRGITRGDSLLFFPPPPPPPPPPPLLHTFSSVSSQASTAASGGDTTPGTPLLTMLQLVAPVLVNAWRAKWDVARSMRRTFNAVTAVALRGAVEVPLRSRAAVVLPTCSRTRQLVFGTRAGRPTVAVTPAELVRAAAAGRCLLDDDDEAGGGVGGGGGGGGGGVDGVGLVTARSGGSPMSTSHYFAGGGVTTLDDDIDAAVDAVILPATPASPHPPGTLSPFTYVGGTDVDMEVLLQLMLKYEVPLHDVGPFADAARTSAAHPPPAAAPPPSAAPDDGDSKPRRRSIFRTLMGAGGDAGGEGDHDVTAASAGAIRTTSGRSASSGVKRSQSAVRSRDVRRVFSTGASALAAGAGVPDGASVASGGSAPATSQTVAAAWQLWGSVWTPRTGAAYQGDRWVALGLSAASAPTYVAAVGARGVPTLATTAPPPPSGDAAARRHVFHLQDAAAQAVLISAELAALQALEGAAAVATVAAARADTATTVAVATALNAAAAARTAADLAAGDAQRAAGTRREEEARRHRLLACVAPRLPRRYRAPGRASTSPTRAPAPAGGFPIAPAAAVAGGDGRPRPRLSALSLRTDMMRIQSERALLPASRAGAVADATHAIGVEEGTAGPRRDEAAGQASVAPVRHALHETVMLPRPTSAATPLPDTAYVRLFGAPRAGVPLPVTADDLAAAQDGVVDMDNALLECVGEAGERALRATAYMRAALQWSAVEVGAALLGDGEAGAAVTLRRSPPLPGTTSGAPGGAGGASAEKAGGGADGAGSGRTRFDSRAVDTSLSSVYSRVRGADGAVGMRRGSVVDERRMSISTAAAVVADATAVAAIDGTPTTGGRRRRGSVSASKPGTLRRTHTLAPAGFGRVPAPSPGGTGGRATTGIHAFTSAAAMAAMRRAAAAYRPLVGIAYVVPLKIRTGAMLPMEPWEPAWYTAAAPPRTAAAAAAASGEAAVASVIVLPTGSRTARGGPPPTTAAPSASMEPTRRPSTVGVYGDTALLGAPPPVDDRRGRVRMMGRAMEAAAPSGLGADPAAASPLDGAALLVPGAAGGAAPMVLTMRLSGLPLLPLAVVAAGWVHVAWTDALAGFSVLSLPGADGAARGHGGGQRRFTFTQFGGGGGGGGGSVPQLAGGRGTQSREVRLDVGMDAVSTALAQHLAGVRTAVVTALQAAAVADAGGASGSGAAAGALPTSSSSIRRGSSAGGGGFGASGDSSSRGRSLLDAGAGSGGGGRSRASTGSSVGSTGRRKSVAEEAFFGKSGSGSGGGGGGGGGGAGSSPGGTPKASEGGAGGFFRALLSPARLASTTASLDLRPATPGSPASATGSRRRASLVAQYVTGGRSTSTLLFGSGGADGGGGSGSGGGGAPGGKDAAGSDVSATVLQRTEGRLSTVGWARMYAVLYADGTLAFAPAAVDVSPAAASRYCTAYFNPATRSTLTSPFAGGLLLSSALDVAPTRDMDAPAHALEVVTRLGYLTLATERAADADSWLRRMRRAVLEPETTLVSTDDAGTRFVGGVSGSGASDAATGTAVPSAAAAAAAATTPAASTPVDAVLRALTKPVMVTAGGGAVRTVNLREASAFKRGRYGTSWQERTVRLVLSHVAHKAATDGGGNTLAATAAGGAGGGIATGDSSGGSSSSLTGVSGGVVGGIGRGPSPRATAAPTAAAFLVAGAALPVAGAPSAGGGTKRARGSGAVAAGAAAAVVGGGGGSGGGGGVDGLDSGMAPASLGEIAAQSVADVHRAVRSWAALVGLEVAPGVVDALLVPSLLASLGLAAAPASLPATSGAPSSSGAAADGSDGAAGGVHRTGSSADGGSRDAAATALAVAAANAAGATRRLGPLLATLPPSIAASLASLRLLAAGGLQAMLQPALAAHVGDTLPLAVRLLLRARDAEVAATKSASPSRIVAALLGDVPAGRLPLLEASAMYFRTSAKLDAMRGAIPLLHNGLPAINHVTSRGVSPAVAAAALAHATALAAATSAAAAAAATAAPAMGLASHRGGEGGASRSLLADVSASVPVSPTAAAAAGTSRSLVGGLRKVFGWGGTPASASAPAAPTALPPVVAPAAEPSVEWELGTDDRLWEFAAVDVGSAAEWVMFLRLFAPPRVVALHHHLTTVAAVKPYVSLSSPDMRSPNDDPGGETFPIPLSWLSLTAQTQLTRRAPPPVVIHSGAAASLPHGSVAAPASPPPVIATVLSADGGGGDDDDTPLPPTMARRLAAARSVSRLGSSS